MPNKSYKAKSSLSLINVGIVVDGWAYDCQDRNVNYENCELFHVF